MKSYEPTFAFSFVQWSSNLAACVVGWRGRNFAAAFRSRDFAIPDGIDAERFALWLVV